jgi:hypothetical protein
MSLYQDPEFKAALEINSAIFEVEQLCRKHEIFESVRTALFRVRVNELGGAEAFIRGRVRREEEAAPSGSGSEGDGVPACSCAACVPMDYAKPETVRLITCAICGNKRCPHATDHRHACTNSNEPGQPGSAYAAAPHGVKTPDGEQHG